MAHQVWTWDPNGAKKGAEVEQVTIAGGSVTIPAIVLGEHGRGRKRTIVSVAGLPQAPSREQDSLLVCAEVAKSRTGRPKLIARPEHEADNSAVLVVVRVPAGFRGSASLSAERDHGGVATLAEGICAQGAAGRMGGHTEYLIKLPARTVVALRRTGRLYGAPPKLYAAWDGEKLLVASEEEREAITAVDEDHPLALP